MNARVRRPGARPSVIASAAPRRVSRSGCIIIDSPRSSGITVPSGSVIVISAVSSLKKRTQAERPVTSFSVSIFSSGSVRR